jgi:hypothetical protein
MQNGFKTKNHQDKWRRRKFATAASVPDKQVKMPQFVRERRRLLKISREFNKQAK